MRLGDILRANADKARREENLLPAFRKCLSKVLVEAIEHATESGSEESFVFLSSRHASPFIVREMAMAVKDRGSSKHFEMSISEMEEECGLPVIVGLTSAGKVVFIFGREIPGPVRLEGRPVRLRPDPEPDTSPRNQLGGKGGVRALPPPDNMRDIPLRPRS